MSCLSENTHDFLDDLSEDFLIFCEKTSQSFIKKNFLVCNKQICWSFTIEENFPSPITKSAGHMRRLLCLHDRLLVFYQYASCYSLRRPPAMLRVCISAFFRKSLWSPVRKPFNLFEEIFQSSIKNRFGLLHTYLLVFYERRKLSSFYNKACWSHEKVFLPACPTFWSSMNVLLVIL